MNKISDVESHEQGVRYYSFHCPGCGRAHMIRVPGWTFNGDYEKPTITDSILVNDDLSKAPPGVFRCHSHVTNGRIQFLGDCTHPLKGQTVDLPDF